jgi:hypothetical protein
MFSSVPAEHFKKMPGIRKGILSSKYFSINHSLWNLKLCDMCPVKLTVQLSAL